MDRKERGREKINAEFQQFRKEMLVLPPMVLFDKCKQIWFKINTMLTEMYRSGKRRGVK